MSNRNRARKRRAVAPAAVAPSPAAARPSKQAHPTHEPRRPAGGPTTAPFQRGSLIAAGGAALVAFVVYALTVQPSVPAGDSGELVTAAYVHGVPHPPGYPLYMIIGYVVSHLPGAAPALWMNLLSALFDALAVGVGFLVVYRLISQRPDAPRRWTPYVAAAVGALLLAFSSLFWAYSIVAEVFALNNLFGAVLLLIGIEWCRRPDRTRLLWLFMLLFGLALCNQQTIVLFVPAFVVLAWRGWVLLPRAAGVLRIKLRDLGIAVGALVVGLLPYFYLPLAAATNPLMDWGHPTTAGRFVCHVSRCDYGSTSLVVGGKPGSVWENLRLLATALTHGFIYAGIGLAVAGLWWTWRNRRAEGIALFTAFLVAGPAFQIYTRTSYPDELTKGVVARFYILPSVPLAILAGLGAWWVLGLAERMSVPRRGLVKALAAAALLVVPVASAADHYSFENQTGNYVAENYGKDLLGPLKPNALLIMHADENLTSVVYAQFVAHLRPDVVAVDSELLKKPSYVGQVRREHPEILIPFTAYDGGVHTSLNKMVAANLPNRPVYTAGGQREKKFGKPFSKLDLGLVDEWVPKGSVSSPYEAIQADPQRFTRLHFPTGTYAPESWERAALGQDYAAAAFTLAFALDSAGRSDPQLEEKMYRVAIELNPKQAAAYKNLGLLLYDRGGDPKEVISLWTTFLKLNSNDGQAGAIRTALEKLKGRQGGS